MGSENAPQIPKNVNSNLHTNTNQYNHSNSHPNPNHINTLAPKEIEKLNPIRRHSNIYNSYNSGQHSNLYLNNNPIHIQIPNQSKKIIEPVFEENKSRKMSQKYCEDFKKNYLENDRRNNFLNHLADSLRYGKEIPIEEVESFKRDYLPQYTLDWRTIEDQKTGVKIWKNFGKIQSSKIGEFLSKLGDNMIKSTEPFFLRRCWFFRYLTKMFFMNKNQNPIVTVNRHNILEDSYNVFIKQKFNIARPLNIRFSNEIIIDEGGIYRDWYQNMFQDIINPNKKLFLVNPYKTLEPFNIIIYPKYAGMKFELYEFIGKFIIKSLVDMIIIRNFIINKFQLKLITKKPINLDDMKYYNLDLYQKLKYINDTPILGNKQLENIKFVWNINNNNINQEIELIPGGKNINLNDQNKNLFINKVIYVEAIMPFEEQIKYIQKGLFSILGEGVQGIFSVEEMNFMITGQEDIDLNDLRENIIYKGEYNENHPLIKLFWEKLLSWNKNELIKFLQFATGSSAVPIDGFGALKDIYGRIQKFTVEPFMNFSAENPDIYEFHKIESKKQYNTISLPKYRTKQELFSAMDMTINNNY